MSLDIVRIELFVVELPLVQPFTISVGSVHSRRLVLVKMTDRQGVIGWGEATPLEEPIYKPDYFGSTLAVLEQILAPAILRRRVYDTPEEFDDSLAFVRGHYFAKAALSIAAYDIAAQKKNQNLAEYLGATKTEIALSHTIAITKSPQEMLNEAARAVDEGYRMLLPAGGGHDVVDGGAVGARQQFYNKYQLAFFGRFWRHCRDRLKTCFHRSALLFGMFAVADRLGFFRWCLGLGNSRLFRFVRLWFTHNGFLSPS